MLFLSFFSLFTLVLANGRNDPLLKDACGIGYTFDNKQGYNANDGKCREASGGYKNALVWKGCWCQFYKYVFQEVQ
jgi:hypothetical protein